MKCITPLYKLLFLMLGFIALLIAIRIKMSNSIQYIFLIWNLFLAWIPFEISRHVKMDNKKWQNILLVPTWLLFFPNALYIITDLIHIRNYGHDKIPVWYDAILLFASSLLGLVFAFFSLKNIEQFAQCSISKKWIGWFPAAVIFLGSFGVYLGRFQRWNSWDIISNPGSLLVNVFERFINPFDHLRTWSVTFVLFGLFSIMYLFIKNINLFFVEKKSS